MIGVVIVGAEHGVRAGYYGYYGYYGYGYGYAHPGEVSVMQRLMPWKASRKGQAPDPVRAPRIRRGPIGPVVRPRRRPRRRRWSRRGAALPSADDPWV